MSNEAQIEEIETLKSIYFPEELQVRESKNPDVLCILAWVPLSLPDDYPIKYFANHGDKEPSVFKVKHLPPLHVKINLPHDYPATRVAKIKLKCEWLMSHQMARLLRVLHQIWRKNKYSPIVFTWLEYLKSDTLAVLNIESGLDITDFSKSAKKGRNRGFKASKLQVDEAKAVKPATENQNAVLQIIQSYDKEQRKADFMKEYHLCEICFTDKPGRDCMMLDRCNHTYCRECLSGYFTVLINEGNSSNLRCPGYKCVTEVTQSQLRELVPRETFEKHDMALLSATLDKMGDIVYCPRRICQYPVTWEPEERLAVCPRCSLAFCIYCKMVYHGVEPCKYTAEERKRLVEVYQNGSSEEKLQLEKRYGKKQVTSLVHNTLNEVWVKENSKTCPQCKSSIEKSEGCNKMTCFRCQAFFCWLCETMLNPAEPYLHFRDPRSPCFEKLFHLVPEDNEAWGDWEIFEDEDSGESDLEGENTDTDG